MTLSSPADGAVVLTASGLFGTLAGPKTVPTQLETRYDLKTQLAKVPRLKWPANGAPHLLIEAVKAVPGAEKMGLTEQGPLRYMDFFKLGYSPEATEKIAESIKKGAVRTETWESVHELPYVVGEYRRKEPCLLRVSVERRIDSSISAWKQLTRRGESRTFSRQPFMLICSPR